MEEISITIRKTIENITHHQVNLVGVTYQARVNFKYCDATHFI